MNKSMNLSGMTYNDLKAGYEALMVSINEQMEKCREYQQAMDIKRANDVKEALRFLMDTYGLTKDEMKTYLDGEDSITPITIKEVDDQTEAVDISEVVEIAQAGDEEPLALPESSQEGEVETEVSINPEPQEENKGESKTTSVFDHPALKAPYSPVTAKKKSATPVDKTSVEKAIEFAKTLPVAEGIDINKPYFVTYEFAVSKKGELTQDAETFGRNETVETISKIKSGDKGSAKSLHATDVVFTDDCSAYMWYNGKYITVTIYHIPVKGSTATEAEEPLPTMDSLLSDDPEYKAFYHPITPVKKNTLPTMDELLSGEPINRILCLGNEVPDDKAYKQHYRITHVDGIIPTETATGQTIIYIPPAPSMAA